MWCNAALVWPFWVVTADTSGWVESSVLLLMVMANLIHMLTIIKKCIFNTFLGSWDGSKGMPIANDVLLLFSSQWYLGDP